MCDAVPHLDGVLEQRPTCSFADPRAMSLNGVLGECAPSPLVLNAPPVAVSKKSQPTPTKKSGRPVVTNPNVSVESDGVLAADQFFKTKLCIPYTKGRCRRGDQCCFAHGKDELRSRVELFHTRLCDKWLRNECTSESCVFAHGEQQLVATTDYYRTSLCKYWKRGAVCDAGEGCRHAHGEGELRTRRYRKTQQDKLKGSSDESILLTPVTQGASFNSNVSAGDSKSHKKTRSKGTNASVAPPCGGQLSKRTLGKQTSKRSTADQVNGQQTGYHSTSQAAQVSDSFMGVERGKGEDRHQRPSSPHSAKLAELLQSLTCGVDVISDENDALPVVDVQSVSPHNMKQSHYYPYRELNSIHSPDIHQATFPLSLGQVLKSKQNVAAAPASSTLTPSVSASLDTDRWAEHAYPDPIAPSCYSTSSRGDECLTSLGQHGDTEVSEYRGKLIRTKADPEIRVEYADVMGHAGGMTSSARPIYSTASEGTGLVVPLAALQQPLNLLQHSNEALYETCIDKPVSAVVRELPLQCEEHDKVSSRKHLEGPPSPSATFNTSALSTSAPRSLLYTGTTPDSNLRVTAPPNTVFGRSPLLRITTEFSPEYDRAIRDSHHRVVPVEIDGLLVTAHVGRATGDHCDNRAGIRGSSTWSSVASCPDLQKALRGDLTMRI